MTSDGHSESSLKYKLEYNMELLKKLKPMKFEDDEFHNPNSANLHQPMKPKPKRTYEEDVEECDMIKAVLIDYCTSSMESLGEICNVEFKGREDVFQMYAWSVSATEAFRLSRNDGMFYISYRGGFFYPIDTSTNIIMNLNTEITPAIYMGKEIQSGMTLSHHNKSNSLSATACNFIQASTHEVHIPQ
ncbi:hypothetical protein PmNV_068 [Penaeus monodon nudivirus]|uniref:Uncharacterized protein n=1 Tax=Penaeus monodon nudivirus TaxID=1529056 RepID=A0A076FIZ8_9VIRU|nr:hypothetical protein PmNV_068 [Penaeus monodon nudivirus]AII15856.1 hypothetical protein PmNV_068 [Penaeus monodon nudivirus]